MITSFSPYCDPQGHLQMTCPVMSLPSALNIFLCSPGVPATPASSLSLYHARASPPPCSAGALPSAWNAAVSIRMGGSTSLRPWATITIISAPTPSPAFHTLLCFVLPSYRHYCLVNSTYFTVFILLSLHMRVREQEACLFQSLLYPPYVQQCPAYRCSNNIWQMKERMNDYL